MESIIKYLSSSSSAPDGANGFEKLSAKTNIYTIIISQSFTF